MMALDTTNYQEGSVALGVGDVENPLAVEVGIDPARNGGADVLCTYTGTLKFSFTGAHHKWRRGVLEAVIPTPGRQWTLVATRVPGRTHRVKATVIAAPSSMYNLKAADYAGWAVDAADVTVKTEEAPGYFYGYLLLQALIAVSDADGILYRISYQVTALGQTS
jgi:hypothetical protein